jgi:hypothetical protein
LSPAEKNCRRPWRGGSKPDLLAVAVANQKRRFKEPKTLRSGVQAPSARKAHEKMRLKCGKAHSKKNIHGKIRTVNAQL